MAKSLGCDFDRVVRDDCWRCHRRSELRKSMKVRGHSMVGERTLSYG